MDPRRRRAVVSFVLLFCGTAAACRRPQPASTVEAGHKPFVESVSTRSAAELGELTELLHDRQYDELERRLVAAQAAYEADPARELEPEAVFATFYSSDPAHEAPLRAWTEARPGSAVAHLARGRYLAKRGWLRRGHQFVHRTPAVQFRRMEAEFAAARAELRRALELNPRLTLADMDLMDIALAEGDEAEVRARFDHALEVNPLSYTIRRTYLGTLTPPWGREPDEIDAIAAEAQKHAAANPRLQVLKGFRAAHVEGPEAYRAGDFTAALRHYDAALSHGEEARYLRGRVETLQKLGRHREAIADCDRVLEIWPQAIKTLRLRAGSLHAMGEVDKALEDVALGLSFDPADEDLLAFRAWALEIAGRPEGGLADVEKALRARPESAPLWSRKGLLLVEHLGDVEQGRAACRRAVALDPRHSDGWLCVGLAQAREGNAASRTTLARYLELSEDPDAWGRLAARYRDGRGVEKDAREAARLYGVAARRGDVQAQSNFGYQLMNGDGVAKDYAEAARWLEAAARAGDASAMCHIGLLYHEGWGVPRDLAVAADWFGKSVAAGYVHARYNLGVMHWDARGFPRDVVTAYRLIKGAADHGDHDARKVLPELLGQMSPAEIQAGEKQLAAERAASHS